MHVVTISITITYVFSLKIQVKKETIISYPSHESYHSKNKVIWLTAHVLFATILNKLYNDMGVI